MPTENIIELLIYVIPGFLVMQIYRTFYPVKERSDFIEVTWSVIYGISIYAIIKWLDINVFGLYLRSNVIGFPSLRFIAALFGAGFVVGLIRVLIHFLRIKTAMLNDRLSFLLPDPQSIWAKIAPTGQWAIVFLDDSSIYMGWISNYTFNPNYTEHDFLLSDAKRVDENLKELYFLDGIGVYLNTRDVKRIEFVKSPKNNNTK